MAESAEFGKAASKPSYALVDDQQAMHKITIFNKQVAINRAQGRQEKKRLAIEETMPLTEDV